MKLLLDFIYNHFERNHHRKKRNKDLLIKIHTFIFSNNFIIRLIFGVKIDDRPHKRTYPHKYDLTTILLKNFLEKMIRKNNKNLKVLEIGTGSYGILAIYLRKKFNINIVATDLDPRAIESTKLNLKFNNVNIEVFESDLFQNINSNNYDLIFWNLPYYKKIENYLTGLISQSDKYLKNNGKLILGYNTTTLDPRVFQNIVNKNHNLIYANTVNYSWNKHAISVISKS